METQFFNTSEDASYFQVSLSNANFTADVTFCKSTGLVYNYSFGGNLTNEDKGTFYTSNYDLKLEYSWVLSPSHTSTFDFYSYEPLIDYEVTQAGFSNNTIGFPINVDQNNNQDEFGPIWGEGEFLPDQLMNANLWDIRGFNETDGGPGYELQLQTDTGELVFNISIELPTADPMNNSLYLYPMFVQTDYELAQGYFGVAEAMNENISTTTDTQFGTLIYDDGRNYLEVKWELTTGVMVHWLLNMEVEDDPGVTMDLELRLIYSTSLSEIDPYWGETTVGSAHTYEIKSLNTSTGHKIDMDDPTQYLEEGDLMYFEMINNSVFPEPRELNLDQENNDNGDNGNDGPHAYYKLVSPHVDDEIRINMQYPGRMEWDGPPMLMPHVLLGTEIYWDWVESLYYWAGGEVDLVTYNSTHIFFDWDLETIGSDFTGKLHVSWLKSTGVLMEYLVSINEAITDPEAFEMHLIYNHVGTHNFPPPVTTSNSTSSVTTTTPTTPTEETSDGGPALPFSTPLAIFSGMMLVPLLRRKNKNK